MSWLKDLLAKWKVTVAVVGGCLVVATMYGTCTYEPATSDEGSEEVSEKTQAEETTTEAVSNTETVDNNNETSGGETSENTTNEFNEVKASDNNED